MPKVEPPPIRLTLLAHAEVDKLAEEYNVSPVALTQVVVDSAKHELSSAAMKHVPWFIEQPRHSFCAARIRNGNKTSTLTLFMIVSPRDGVVYSNVEAQLPDEYFAERVLEETRLELKLGHL